LADMFPIESRTVLVTTGRITDDRVDLNRLRDAGLVVVERPDLGSVASEAGLVEALQGVWAVIAGNEAYTRLVIRAADALRVIARPGVGYDAIDLQAASDHRVLVFTTPGLNSSAVGDFTVALILAVQSRITSLNDSVRSGEWQVGGFNRAVTGSTIGIVGVGAIGRAVAHRLVGFGCRLLAVEPRPDHDFFASHRVELMSLEEMLPQLDVLVLTCALTPETYHLIGKAELECMRPSAVLVNTARGSIVDEAALIDALERGVIGGAALDVFETEPLRQGHALMKFPNVILTGHVASRTLDAAEAMMNAAIDGVVELAQGRSPRAGRLLNPEAHNSVAS
jgi:D-3-phosphoglycerate dehydrogenase